MAKPPATVKVGPYRVTVVQQQAAIDRASIDSGSRLAGRFDADTLTITLDPKLAADMCAETLLHEVLHACSEATGKPLGRDGEGGDDEEKLVGALAPCLLDTLRRNPDLVSFLLSDV